MSDIRKKISSDYFSALNKMKGKNARRRIVVYVEGYDDVFFWRSILGNLENEELYFEIILPKIDNVLERGKKSAMASLMSNKQLGKNMLACVDADYDYLLQGRTSSSAMMLSNPFVLHTYAYAIENLQCYADSLHSVCVMATLNDSMPIDLPAFMQTFSEIIYPLFLWNVWYYRKGMHGDFPLSAFNSVIEMGKVSMHNIEEQFEKLQRKVGRKVKTLEKQHADAVTEVKTLGEDLQRDLGILPKETYLYIQGHFLFEHIVAPLLSKLCYALIRSREEEIRRSARHVVQQCNELSSYSHSVQNLSQMLKKNTGYCNSTIFFKILDDAKRAISI